MSWVPALIPLLPIDVVGTLPQAPTATPSLSWWTTSLHCQPKYALPALQSFARSLGPSIKKVNHISTLTPKRNTYYYPQNFKLPDRFHQYEFFTLTPCTPLALKLLFKKVLWNINEITWIWRHLRITKNVPTRQLGVSICQDGCRIESLEESQVKNNHPVLPWNCLCCFFLDSPCWAVSLLRR